MIQLIKNQIVIELPRELTIEEAYETRLELIETLQELIKTGHLTYSNELQTNLQYLFLEWLKHLHHYPNSKVVRLTILNKKRGKELLKELSLTSELLGLK